MSINSAVVNHIRVSVFGLELNYCFWLVATLDGLHGNRSFVEWNWLFWLRSADRDDGLPDIHIECTIQDEEETCSDTTACFNSVLSIF